MTNTQKQRFMGDAANERPAMNHENLPVSQEQLQRETDYARAQRILESLLQNGLAYNFVQCMLYEVITQRRQHG